MAKLLIVKERESTGMSKRNIYTRRAHLQYGAWKTIGKHTTLDAAREQRGARSTGLFQRIVTYKGRVVVDAHGRLTAMDAYGRTFAELEKAETT